MIPKNLLVKLFGGIPHFQTQPQFQMLGFTSQTQESIHIISISYPHALISPLLRKRPQLEPVKVKSPFGAPSLVSRQ